MNFAQWLNRRSDTRPDSPLGAPTTGALIPPPLARRNFRPAPDNKFVLSPRPGPRSHRNHGLLNAAPNYRQYLSPAPRKSAPTTFCSRRRFPRNERSDLSSLAPKVHERPPHPRLKRSSRQSALRHLGSRQRQERPAFGPCRSLASEYFCRRVG